MSKLKKRKNYADSNTKLGPPKKSKGATKEDLSTSSKEIIHDQVDFNSNQSSLRVSSSSSNDSVVALYEQLQKVLDSERATGVDKILTLEKINEQDQEGTLLHIACRKGNIDMVTYLL